MNENRRVDLILGVLIRSFLPTKSILKNFLFFITPISKMFSVRRSYFGFYRKLLEAYKRQWL